MDPPPGVSNLSSFPVDWNSKIPITGQSREETGPCSDKRPHTSDSQSQGNLPNKKAPWKKQKKKVPWRSKREGAPPQSKWCHPTHSPLHWEPSWLRDARTHGRTLRYTKHGLRTRQVKMIGRSKPGRNVPYKWFKPPLERDSLSPAVYLATDALSS